MSAKLAEGAPGVGVSITANIGSDRQIVLQGFYARGDQAEGDALIADMNGRIDAMKAPHEIRELERTLETKRDAVKHAARNLELLDENAAREQAKRVVAVQEAETQLAEADKKARLAWTTKRKEGDYVEGNTVRELRVRVEAFKERTREEGEKAESERLIAAEQNRLNIQKFERDIDELEKLIAKQRALLPDDGG